MTSSGIPNMSIGQGRLELHGSYLLVELREYAYNHGGNLLYDRESDDITIHDHCGPTYRFSYWDMEDGEKLFKLQEVAK